MDFTTLCKLSASEQAAWAVLQERVSYPNHRRREAIRTLRKMLHRLEEEYNSDIDETSRVWYNANSTKENTNGT